LYNRSLKKNIKVYQLHTYRTYETLSRNGYKSYIFEGKIVKDRKLSFIVPSEYKDEVNKQIGDVFSVDVSSFILNKGAFDI